ncbi:MAG: thioredoxin family protein [Deltaproteobacteria bacterium]|nr:thioredoxin family protein [Deltaproteobacteria bacterium]
MSFQPKTQLLPFGAEAPDFNLSGVDGKKHSLHAVRGKTKAVVVIFACNHCPYVVAYEDRMIQITKDYLSKGVSVFVINANDEKNYPEDSFENMQERAKLKEYPYPYLRDADQKVATLFGAGCTPEVFLLDASLKHVYHGRIDDNWQDPKKVAHPHLRNALDAVLSGKPIARQETHPIGCSIKWTT